MSEDPEGLSFLDGLQKTIFEDISMGRKSAARKPDLLTP
jgi:hypothetical protein